ncbi:MAG: hypothetical protein JO103_05510, partial [Candidatus Eremiobacteraeota bacterium]|nr:hypothetical protein [Candidatus Eremiobacteraeota bacterium]MBV9409180.1 hypothetical protein [Candidatus Eremiobacteraeota bacterium]
VRATVTRGDARFDGGSPSADATADGTGAFVLTFLPGTQAGPLIVALDVSGHPAELDLSLTAAERRPLVVGVATGGIGPVPGWVEATDDAPNGTNTRRGTVSVFGSGKVSKNTRGTFAYDTRDDLAQSLSADPFLDNPNDRPFPVYGDTAIRYDDALSTDHLFARIENGRSSAMWGEFRARSTPSADAVGGYDVLVNGARLHSEGNNVALGAFTSRNDVAYARQVIAPTGLAVASEALHPDIVVGSDVLTLVALDRRSGAILSQKLLARGSDYVVDYASGLLRFTNVILPLDGNFDPQIVVVQYEYGGAGAKSTMLGGNGTLKFTGGGHADAWYLNNSIGSGNVTLLGESLAGATSATTWSLSHERSNGFLPITTAQYGTSGDAYRASLETRADHFHASLNYADTAAGYSNPYGAYAAPGLVSVSARTSFDLSRISALELSYLYARNTLPATFSTQAVDNHDATGAVTLRVKPNKRLAYHLGVKADGAASNGVLNPAVLFSDPTQAPALPNSFGGGLVPMLNPLQYQAGEGHSFDAEYGVDWRFAPHASLGLARTSPLGGTSVDPYDPPTTQAELDVDVGQKGKAFIRQLWQRTSLQALGASQAAQTYAASASSTTSVGLEQQIGAATFQTGYAVDHTANGTDLYDAIGVRTKVIATKRLNADGFMQWGQSLFSTYGAAANGTKPNFFTIGTALDYSEKTFHANGQVQIREGFDSGSTFQLGATGPISPAVSLFGAYTGSFTEGVRSTEARAGLAYRPSRNDRYVTLVSVDSLQSNLTNYDAYVTNVAQVQELYRSSTRTEWAGSLAYKITGDSFFAPRTSIFGLRGDQRIGGRLDLAAEGHWSDVAPIHNAQATGLALEAGYRIGSTLRLAGGYNFSGFADPTTAINPTHRGAYATLTSYIDRIFGWGKEARP